MRRRGRDRVWFLYSKRRNARPLSLYKQGKQGQFAHLAGCYSNLRNLRRSLPFFPKLKESSAPPPIATSITNAVDLPHHLRHGSESRQGEGREIG